MLKITNKELSTVRCAYLYSTGELVLWHEKAMRIPGTAQRRDVSWITLHQVDAPIRGEGRIVFHSFGILRTLADAVRISWGDTSSESSRAKGVNVHYLTVELGPNDYRDAISTYDLPSLISGGFTMQEQTLSNPPAPDALTWDCMPIVRKAVKA